MLGIVNILLQQGSATAPQLAQRFEVSRRTINRDVEDICRAGIPLVTRQGYGGGISIAPGYKLRTALLAPEEVQNLLAGLRGLDSVSPTPYLPGFAEKLAAAPAEGPILIDLADHYQAPLTQKIGRIKQAIGARQVLEFWYCCETGEGLRTVEPYRLVFQWSAWYLLGYCLQRQGFRLFKLNRLWALRPTGQAFNPRPVPPQQLDFGARLAGGQFHLQAVFAPAQKYRLVEEYGPDCWHPAPQGGLLFEWDFASYANLLQWVLSFGDQVQVLGPPRLRRDCARQARNMAFLYGAAEK